MPDRAPEPVPTGFVAGSLPISSCRDRLLRLASKGLSGPHGLVRVPAQIDHRMRLPKSHYFYQTVILRRWTANGFSLRLRCMRAPAPGLGTLAGALSVE